MLVDFLILAAAWGGEGKSSGPGSSIWQGGAGGNAAKTQIGSLMLSFVWIEGKEGKLRDIQGLWNT